MKFAGRVSWQQQMEREQQWHERLLTSDHPAFGLGPTWAGPRSLGDVHFVGDGVESVGLAHGDPIDRSHALIHVHTTRLPAEQFDDVMAQRSELFARASRAVPAPVFEQLPLELDIDGQRAAVFGVSAADGWLARASPRPDVTVYVESHRLALPAFVEQHQVIEITDLVPYLEGRVAMLRRMRG